MLIEERPRWHHDEECQGCAAEPDVKRLVDVLHAEAHEEGDRAEEGEESIGEVFCETLAFEVLRVRTGVS